MLCYPMICSKGRKQLCIPFDPTRNLENYIETNKLRSSSKKVLNMPVLSVAVQTVLHSWSIYSSKVHLG